MEYGTLMDTVSFTLSEKGFKYILGMCGQNLVAFQLGSTCYRPQALCTNKLLGISSYKSDIFIKRLKDVIPCVSEADLPRYCLAFLYVRHVATSAGQRGGGAVAIAGYLREMLRATALGSSAGYQRCGVYPS